MCEPAKCLEFRHYYFTKGLLHSLVICDVILCIQVYGTSYHSFLDKLFDKIHLDPLDRYSGMAHRSDRYHTIYNDIAIVLIRTCKILEEILEPNYFF